MAFHGWVAYHDHFQNLSCFNFFLDGASCDRFGHFLLLPTTMGYYQRHFIGSFHELFMLVSTITLWLNAKVITGKMNIKNGTFTWDHLEKSSLFLQKLADKINELIGNSFLLFILESVIHLSTRTQEAVLVGEYFFNLYVGFGTVLFFLSSISILALAADICSQVQQSFKHYLKSGLGHLVVDCQTVARIQLAWSELESNPVSVKAAGIVPITYPVIASVSLKNNFDGYLCYSYTK